MPEEVITNAQNQAVEPANTQEATQTATNTQNNAVEASSPKETQFVEQKPQEPSLTLDSYKDIGLEEYRDFMDLNEDGVKEFKQFGVDNKISPQAMKALVEWSVKTMKGQQESFKKMQEGWQAENAKKYGENLKNVQTNVGRVLADFDKSGSFANLLKDAGAEQHPATLEFLNSLADVLLEKGSINPNASPEGKEMTLEDMYKIKSN